MWGSGAGEAGSKILVFVTISCISGTLVVNKGKGWKYQDRCVSSTFGGGSSGAHLMKVNIFHLWSTYCIHKNNGWQMFAINRADRILLSLGSSLSQLLNSAICCIGTAIGHVYTSEPGCVPVKLYL